VFVCRDRASQQQLALKRIAENGPEKDLVGFPLTALREMKILKALRHDNILNLKEIVTSKSKCF
jgi:serine/threonine protein kinase